MRVQTRTETLNTPHHEHEFERKNDIYIFDCCRYFRTRGETAFITADINLSATVEGETRAIPGEGETCSLHSTERYSYFILLPRNSYCHTSSKGVVQQRSGSRSFQEKRRC